MTNTSQKTKKITETALMTALICILGPLSIPIGPIPISLTNMAIYFALYAIGTRQGIIAYTVYFLLGMAGLPVFSGFTGGISKVAGPTGGYLVGFFLMALIGGFFIERYYNNVIVSVIGMYTGKLGSATLGVLWLSFSTGITIKAAILSGVVPFLLIDLIKIILVAIVGKDLRIRLIRGGMFIGNDRLHKKTPA